MYSSRKWSGDILIGEACPPHGFWLQSSNEVPCTTIACWDHTYVAGIIVLYIQKLQLSSLLAGLLLCRVSAAGFKGAGTAACWPAIWDVLSAACWPAASAKGAGSATCWPAIVLSPISMHVVCRCHHPGFRREGVVSPVLPASPPNSNAKKT